MDKYELEKVVKESKTKTECLIKMGLRAAGGNYKTITKYIEEYQISTEHFDIHQARINKMNQMNSERKIPLSEILTENSTYNRHRLKERLYDENIKEEAAKIISPVKQESFFIQTHKDALPFWKRECKCYINFNSIFNYSRSKYGYDRYEALHKIPNNIVFSEKNIVSKEITFVNQSKYAFVISPFGNGLDTHRTWEALVLGCIPIVKTSPLDSLYTNLPVLIISDWNIINNELLENTINDFKEKHEKGKFNYDKLLLKYWVNKINGHKKM